LPAASKARIVITLLPKRSGMLLATQVMLPIAWPELPVEFLQVTEVTAILSVATPERIALAEVAMMLDAG
jgi:hypothetical protein